MEEGKKPYHTLLEKIYVMYKTPYCFGSTGMLATVKLKELAEKEEDFYKNDFCFSVGCPVLSFSV